MTKSTTALPASRRQILKSGAAGAASLSLCAGFPLAAYAHDVKRPDDSLDSHARRNGFLFGTAVSASQLGNTALVDLIKQECSVLVAENAFKWKHVERRAGQYDFQKAHAIADLAQDNKMLLRGHTLAWNQDNRLPDWVVKREKSFGKGTSSKMVDLMGNHIQRMMAEFPTVQSWDVVNEAVQLQDGAIRESALTRTIGPQFIDLAFALAHHVAPEKQRVYNDYMSWGQKSDHRDGVLKMLEGALGRGVKIDALGIQSHIGGTLNEKRDERGWRKFMEEVQAMGLDVIISELDCGDRNVKMRNIPRRDKKTAAYVKGYLDLTLSFTNVKQIVLWGMSDIDSYLNSPRYPEARRRPDGLEQRGHVYDTDLNPKPMRGAIIAAMKAAPKRDNPDI